MTINELSDHFDYILERTDPDCEYARRMILRAWACVEAGRLEEAAFEVRSFPIDVAACSALEEWAKSLDK